jgi:hypothetical protein
LVWCPWNSGVIKSYIVTPEVITQASVARAEQYGLLFNGSGIKEVFAEQKFGLMSQGTNLLCSVINCWSLL